MEQPTTTTSTRTAERAEKKRRAIATVVCRRPSYRATQGTDKGRTPSDEIGHVSSRDVTEKRRRAWTRVAPNRVEPAWEVHARVSNGLRGQRKALEQSEVLARARLDPAKAYDMSSAPSRRGGHSLRRNCSTSKIPLRRYTVRSMRQKPTRSGAEAYPDQRMVSLMSVRQKRMQSAEADFS